MKRFKNNKIYKYTLFMKGNKKICFISLKQKPKKVIKKIEYSRFYVLNDEYRTIINTSNIIKIEVSEVEFF